MESALYSGFVEDTDLTPLWEGTLDRIGGSANCMVCSGPDGRVTLGREPARQGRRIEMMATSEDSLHRPLRNTGT